MVRFEWDQAKNETDKSKHGARLVFDDPFCLTFVGRVRGAEELVARNRSDREHDPCGSSAHVSGRALR